MKIMSTDPALKRTQDTVKNTKSFLLENFATQREKVNEAIKKIFDEYKNWKPTFDEKKSIFQKQVLKLGGDSQKLEEKRTVKVKEIENIEKKLLSIKNKANQIKEIYKIRDGKLKELKKIYRDYFQARKEKCEYFEKVSKNNLKITIIESTNKEEFQRCLAFLKKGSYLRECEIEQLSNN